MPTNINDDWSTYVTQYWETNNTWAKYPTTTINSPNSQKWYVYTPTTQTWYSTKGPQTLTIEFKEINKQITVVDGNYVAFVTKDKEVITAVFKVNKKEEFEIRTTKGKIDQDKIEGMFWFGEIIGNVLIDEKLEHIKTMIYDPIRWYKWKSKNT